MHAPIATRRHLLFALPGLVLAGCAAEPPAAPQAAPVPPPPPTPDARVELRNWRVGVLGQVSWGSGVLTQQGVSRPFRMRGVGAGGAGMARIRATGEVFNLRRVEDFAGVYGQLRGGAVVPGAEIPGTLWLVNSQGVRLALRPQRTGLALQIGADAVVIEFIQGRAPTS